MSIFNTHFDDPLHKFTGIMVTMCQIKQYNNLKGTGVSDQQRIFGRILGYGTLIQKMKTYPYDIFLAEVLTELNT